MIFPNAAVLVRVMWSSPSGVYLDQDSFPGPRTAESLMRSSATELSAFLTAWIELTLILQRSTAKDTKTSPCHQYVTAPEIATRKIRAAHTTSPLRSHPD